MEASIPEDIIPPVNPAIKAVSGSKNPKSLKVSLLYSSLPVKEALAALAKTCAKGSKIVSSDASCKPSLRKDLATVPILSLNLATA